MTLSTAPSVCSDAAEGTATVSLPAPLATTPLGDWLDECGRYFLALGVTDAAEVRAHMEDALRERQEAHTGASAALPPSPATLATRRRLLEFFAEKRTGESQKGMAQ